jgi:hypothetical protein
MAAKPMLVLVRAVAHGDELFVQRHDVLVAWTPRLTDDLSLAEHVTGALRTDPSPLRRACAGKGRLVRRTKSCVSNVTSSAAPPLAAGFVHEHLELTLTCRALSLRHVFFSECSHQDFSLGNPPSIINQIDLAVIPLYTIGIGHSSPLVQQQVPVP